MRIPLSKRSPTGSRNARFEGCRQIRLEAGKLGGVHWHVWHAEECREVKQVVWVDDVTREYCCYVQPFLIVNDVVQREVIRAKRILIVTSARLVIINPIEEQDDEDLLWTHADHASIRAAPYVELRTGDCYYYAIFPIAARTFSA